MLPPALANFVNTLKADVHGKREQIGKLLQEAARLRVPDDRALYEILDSLELMINARFLDLVKTGKLADIVREMRLKLSETPKATVNFPTPGS